MKKDVAEFLEFTFEKLDCLKKSERGEVWRARRRDGELVVIKRVNSTDLPYDKLKRNQFTLPAKIFLCAVDEDEADTVIVEEFIDGENLLTRLEQKNFLSEDEAREILLQMCDGLKELHEQKIIHRDIKPSNLILQGERIRLIDFDAARIFKPEKNSDTQLFGTKGYAPPEQHGFKQTDERSDIFSLGMTMKVLLGGNYGRLEEILDKCTEFDPQNRFQSVDELKTALIDEFGDDEENALPDENSAEHAITFSEIFWLVTGLFLYLNARHKKTWALIFFVATEIFFFATPQHLNSDENFSEPVVEENVSDVTD